MTRYLSPRDSQKRVNEAIKAAHRSSINVRRSEMLVNPRRRCCLKTDKSGTEKKKRKKEWPYRSVEPSPKRVMKRVHGRTVGNRQAGKRGDRSFREHRPDSILNRLSGVPSISNWRDNKFCDGPRSAGPPIPRFQPRISSPIKFKRFATPVSQPSTPVLRWRGWEGGEFGDGAAAPAGLPCNENSGANLMTPDGTFFDRIDEHFPTGSLRFVSAVLSSLSVLFFLLFFLVKIVHERVRRIIG